MRTSTSSAFVLLLASLSAACIYGPADPHPACAEVGVGTTVEFQRTNAADANAIERTLQTCTAKVVPGVQASGFDAEVQVDCLNANRDWISASVKFPDFRSRPASSSVEARTSASTVTIDRRTGTTAGDDVTTNYTLGGVLHLRVENARMLTLGQEHFLPFSVDVPFEWTASSFKANYDRCPQ